METYLRSITDRIKPILEQAMKLQVHTFLPYDRIEALLILTAPALRKSFTMHILDEYGGGGTLCSPGADNDILIESLKTKLPDAILLLVKSNFPQNVDIQLNALIYIGLPVVGKIIIHLDENLDCTGQPFMGELPKPIDEYRPRFSRYVPPESLARSIDEILDDDASSSLPEPIYQVDFGQIDKSSPNKTSKYSKFVCLSCDKVYEDVDEYRDHVLYHLKDIEKVLASTYVETVDCSGDTKLYVCKMCDTRFESLKTAGGHVRHRHLPNVSTQSSLTCPLCLNKYKCVYDCVYHIKTSHLKEKNYECRFCQRKFAQKCNMTKHIKDSHEQELALPLPHTGLPSSSSSSSSSSHRPTKSVKPIPVSPKKDKLERLIVKIKKSSLGHHKTESPHTNSGHHEERQKYAHGKMQCLGCSIKFDNQEEFNKHIKIHLAKLEAYVPSTYAKILKGTTGHKFECTFCKNRFPSIKSVCLHIAKNHLDMNEIKENRECLICGLKGRATYDVVKHMEGVHLKEKHTCAICSKMFSRKATWVKHLKEVHSAKEPDSEDDTLTIAVDSPLVVASPSKPVKEEVENGVDGEEENGELPDPTLECRKCAMAFSDSETFKDHVREVHLDDLERSQPDNYVVKVSNDYFEGYQCDICKENFKTYEAATLHATRRHYLAKEEQQCPVCSKTFQSVSAVLSHLRGAHLAENQFQCEACHRIFAKEETLKNHTCQNAANKANIRLSAPTNDNKCLQCDKIFSNKWNLTRHMAEIHQKIKRFSCKMCPRTFSRSCDGIKHMQQMHLIDMYKSPEKGEKCDVCRQEFSDKIRLSAHKRSKHTPKRFRCDVCGKKFMFPSEQYVHTNMKHTWAL
ncbi:unnamed protein product [Dimorphilus gyrociliatus]|uniref:C2H2-type domain-containing protein n=1 Tax=Dimorphilus gyrociliatus TaxID=2664684 RepID=A0A7I8VD49_9ANNE|nr:unnamed protein product [Dimorphilus gyrociliatus]